MGFTSPYVYLVIRKRTQIKYTLQKREIQLQWLGEGVEGFAGP